MIRFISFLLGKEYEECKSCQTLKEQLAICNEEKRELTQTIMTIIRPKVYEAPPIELNQIAQTSALFSRRKAALEQQKREEARVLRNSKVIGKSDSEIQKLEEELNIPSEQAAIAAGE